MPVLAAVEGGGTTYVVAIAKDKPENIIERASFPTTTPEETLAKCKAWLAQRSFDALGIATFGPVDPRTSSKTYGHITKTPKKLWRDADVVGALDVFGVPIKFDTDVNAPALSEYRAMVLKGEDPSCVAYATVGTGVGVGLVVNGAPVHGLLHPEAGHACVPRYPGDDFAGHNPSLNCPGCAFPASFSILVDSARRVASPPWRVDGAALVAPWHADAETNAARRCRESKSDALHPRRGRGRGHVRLRRVGQARGVE